MSDEQERAKELLRSTAALVEQQLQATLDAVNHVGNVNYHRVPLKEALDALRRGRPPQVTVTVHPPSTDAGFAAGLQRGYEEGRRSR